MKSISNKNIMHSIMKSCNMFACQAFVQDESLTLNDRLTATDSRGSLHLNLVVSVCLSVHPSQVYFVNHRQHAISGKSA